MYEHITYEAILARMLSRVEKWARSQGINLDIREGSLIRTALSPAAVELRLMYLDLDEILNETFADTASREFLIRRCAERGIAIELATKALRQGEFSVDVPIGSRFSLSLLNYLVVERISEGLYKLECETPGVVGNQESGPLIPIEYIEGLEWARLTAVLVPGEDEEATEHLRRRYFDSLNSQAFGGNIADYTAKVNSLPGVGGCKVYPVWNGGGTVKIVFLDSLFQKPSETLVNDVQSALDPEQNQGLGLGIAPIGHVVTVEPVSETVIDVGLNLMYQETWGWEELRPYVEAAVDKYFHELASEWAGSATPVVRISQIETRLLNVTGIIDVQDTTLNGVPQNLALGADNIPIRGAIADD